MKLGVKVFVLTLLTSLAVFTFLLYISLIGSNQELPAEAEQGKLIYQEKACVECHTLFGNGGYRGGDLTKSYSRFGRDGLAAYLTDPPLLSGAKKKRHDKLNDKEAAMVAAYLEFVNSVDNLTWPPEPNRKK